MKHTNRLLNACSWSAFATSIALLSVLATSLPANGQVASPVSSAPTGKVIPGEIVWADLVTTDVEAAAAFYTQVFGWQVRPGDDPAYLELANNGQVMAAIARYDDEDVDAGNARWLVSVSVADVDDSARSVEQQGGTVLQSPEDFPARGRFAVVADTQGAVFVLLRALGGDPPENEVASGSWGWAELWTRDVKTAARFYEEALGYRAMHSPDRPGPQLVVLTTEGRPRATIVGIPWDDVEPNWVPYVSVDDARDTLQRVRAASGSVLLTSDEVEDDSGSFAAIVADPTGGVLAIQQAGGAR